MPEQSLDCAEISSIVQEVSGERMPKRVRCRSVWQAKLITKFLDKPLNKSWMQSAATNAPEDRKLGIHAIGTKVEISLDRFCDEWQ